MYTVYIKKNNKKNAKVYKWLHPSMYPERFIERAQIYMKQ